MNTEFIHEDDVEALFKRHFARLSPLARLQLLCELWNIHLEAYGDLLEEEVKA